MANSQIAAAVDQLHQLVDQLANTLSQQHAARLQCTRGCADCCVDDLTVFEIEAERIQARHPALLETGEAHAAGACAMLDHDGACRVYASRPFVCRTQGLPLRWLEQHGTAEAPDVVEMRDICALNLPGPPLEQMPPDRCWSVGPFEARLSAWQEATDGGQGRRISLRSLFHSRCPPPA